MLIIKGPVILTLEDISKGTGVPSDKVIDVTSVIISEVKGRNTQLQQHINPLIHHIYADEPYNKNLVFLLAHQRSKVPSYQSTVEEISSYLKFIIENHELQGYATDIIIKPVDVDDRTSRTKHARLIYGALRP